MCALFSVCRAPLAVCLCLCARACTTENIRSLKGLLNAACSTVFHCCSTGLLLPVVILYSYDCTLYLYVFVFIYLFICVCVCVCVYVYVYGICLYAYMYYIYIYIYYIYNII